MADERTTPALLPSADPRDDRPAFSRPPGVPSRSPSSSEPGLDVADSHARPIAGPRSAERPAIAPAPVPHFSSRPPPVPSPGFLPPPPNPSDEPHLGFEDSADELTPVSVTKPSLPFEASPPSGPLAAVRPVVVLDSLEAFDPLLAPLPPPALIEPPPGGYRSSYRSDDPPSSGPISSGRLPTSVAPPMPQIPKQVSSNRPMIHAPGIVSTQAIPLTVPAKKRGRSPLFVAFAAALIGGMIALAIALSMKPKAKGDTVAAQEAASAAVAPASPTATEAKAAAVAPPASGAAVGDPPPSASSAAPAPTAATKPGSSTSAAPAAPPASPPRAPRKSDRIED